MKKINFKLYKLHPGQQLVEDNLKKYNVVTMGRRFGKSSYLIWKAIHTMIAGKRVGLWIPTYADFFKDYWNEFTKLIPKQLIKTANKNEKTITLITGGSLTIYSTEKAGAGRGAKFHLALIDEAGEHKNLKEYWTEIITYCIGDFEDSVVIFAGTPKGKNYFYDLSLKYLSEPDWSFFTAPSFSNPFLPKETRDEWLAKDPEDPSHKQECYAQFLDHGGDLFGPLSFVTEPQEAEYYKIGIDLAKAVDFTVVAVFNEKNEMVELVRWNHMDWTSIRVKIQSILDKYPERIVVTDATGLGSPVIDEMISEGYEIQSFQFSNKRTALLEKLSLYIAEGKITFIEDEDLIKEFEAFQRYYKDGKIKLISHIHDDIVMACGLAMQAEEPVYNRLLF